MGSLSMVRTAILIVVLAAAGCASTTARTILKDRDSGVVAIPDDTDKFPDYNRSQAIELIREHVGREYEIVKEEEYVLGPTVKNETRFTRRPVLNWLLPWKLAEDAKATNTSTTTNNTEYRIHYQRAAAANKVTPAAATGELPPLTEGVGR